MQDKPYIYVKVPYLQRFFDSNYFISWYNETKIYGLFQNQGNPKRLSGNRRFQD